MPRLAGSAIAGMSNLFYNGISIPYVHTHKVEQDSIRDPSNTDMLFHHFIIRVEGIIRVGKDALNVNNYIVPGNVQDTNPAAVAKRIRHDLMSPRRPLRYDAGGGTLIEVRATPQNVAPFANAAIDAKNGPNPLFCHVKPSGDQTFMVEYAVETWIVDCGTDAQIPQGQVNIDQLLLLPENQRPWVSNRWSESVTLDDTGTTREKSRCGMLITRSDMFLSPDQLRGIVVPPITRGFKRVKAKYRMNEDGLSLSYEFVDEEIWIAPPFPAMKAEGTYAESVQQGDGKRYGEVYLKLTGDKLTPKSDIFSTAIATAMGKLRKQLDNDNGTWIGSVMVEEDLYDNVVSVRIRALLKQTKSREKRLSVELGNFNELPLAGTVGVNGKPGDNQLLPIIGTRGTGGIVLVAAALRDPCLQQNIRNLVGKVDEGPGEPKLQTDRSKVPTLRCSQPINRIRL
jgi:hypothetical protein